MQSTPNSHHHHLNPTASTSKPPGPSSLFGASQSRKSESFAFRAERKAVLCIDNVILNCTTPQQVDDSPRLRGQTSWSCRRDLGFRRLRVAQMPVLKRTLSIREVVSPTVNCLSRIFSQISKRHWVQCRCQEYSGQAAAICDYC